jgi:hypothetical protein
VRRISIRQHTSAYVSIRQHTSAYVSIRPHASAYRSAYVSRRQRLREGVTEGAVCERLRERCVRGLGHGTLSRLQARTSSSRISIRQHTSAYVSIRQRLRQERAPLPHASAAAAGSAPAPPAYVSIRQHTSAYVSIRQHTSAYVSIRQHTSAYVSIRQHTSAYASMRQHTCTCESANAPCRCCTCAGKFRPQALLRLYYGSIKALSRLY